MRRFAIIVLFVLLVIVGGWRQVTLGDAEESNQRPSAIARTLAGVLNHMNLATDWARDVMLREAVWQLNEEVKRQSGDERKLWRNSAEICREFLP